MTDVTVVGVGDGSDTVTGSVIVTGRADTVIGSTIVTGSDIVTGAIGTGGGTDEATTLLGAFAGKAHAASSGILPGGAILSHNPWLIWTAVP